MWFFRQHKRSSVGKLTVLAKNFSLSRLTYGKKFMVAFSRFETQIEINFLGEDDRLYRLYGPVGEMKELQEIITKALHNVEAGDPHRVFGRAGPYKEGET